MPRKREESSAGSAAAPAAEPAAEPAAKKPRAKAPPQDPAAFGIVPLDKLPADTRLVISHMTLENFKSYAGTQVIGPFHKSFSAVVGPNGSGKSNVIDALLFVFGKRSKQIRADKIGGLVHASDAHPDLESCSVHIHFAQVADVPVGQEGPADEGPAMPGAAVVPDSRFTVSRTAKKSNASTYYVNGRPTTMATVTSLLKSRGIDLDHNRFLILQGEVESISLMKPKGLAPGEEGLLEYLEDIIGSNAHLPRIAELQTALEEANHSRAEALARARATERELVTLSGAKREAEAYLAKKREATEARAEEAVGQSAQVKAKFTTAQAAQAAAKAEYDAEIEKNADKRAQLKEADAKVREAQKILADASRTAVKHKNEHTALEKRDAKLQEQLKQGVTAKGKLEKSKAADEKEHAAKANVIDAAKVEIDEAHTAQENLTGQLKVAQDELEKARTEATGELAAAIAEKRAALEPVQEEASAARAEAATAKQEASLLGDKLLSASKAVEEAEDQLFKLREESSTLASRAAAAAQVIEESDGKIAAARAEVDTTTAAADAAKASAHDARLRATAAAERASATKSQSKVLAALMKAKRKKLIPGILGRLGDLGAVPQKYAVAMSSAAGALDNIVVDTTETAQRAVKLLRKYNLGVATFIVMDRIRKQIPACNPPAGAHRLFDLVTELKDPSLAAAFYFAVNDTLVVDSLDQARAIAFNAKGGQRWRIVTLNGELIEMSGAMSGGGGGARRFGAGALRIRVASEDGSAPMDTDATEGDDDEDVEALQGRAAAAEEAAAEATARADQAIQLLTRLERELEEAQLAVDTLEADRAALPDTIQAVEASLPALRDALKAARAGNAEKKYQEALQRAEELQHKAEALDKQVAEAEAEVASLEKDALEAGGTRVAVQQERVNSLQAQLALYQERTKKARADIVKAERMQARIAKRLEGLEGKLAEAEAERVKLEEEYAALASEAQAVKRAYQDAMVEEERLVGKLEEVREEAVALKQELADATNREFDLKAALAKLTKEVAALQSKLDAWTAAVQEQADAYKRLADDIDAANGFDAITPEEEAAMGGAPNAEAAVGDKRPTSPAAGEVVAEAGSPSVKKARSSEAGASVPTAAAEGDDVAPSRAARVLPAVQLSPEEQQALTPSAAKARAVLLEADIAAMSPNMSALAKWRAKEAERKERVATLEQLTSQRDAVRGECDEARKARLDQFMAGFTTISSRLKEMYQLITLGGDAELELVDSLDPFSEGIVFSVRPPKKSWKQIGNLSGGEKTLSSLALVFALHTYKPTPLYVMDEIDAALDFKNVSIVANYVKERTKDAQFIIISLRSYMFELADRLVGIYKTNDCTRSVTVNPASFALTETESGAVSAGAVSSSSGAVTGAETTSQQVEGEVPAARDNNSMSSKAAQRDAENSVASGAEAPSQEV